MYQTVFTFNKKKISVLLIKTLSFFKFLRKLLLLLVIVFLFKIYLFDFYFITSDSMFPCIKTGDIILVNKILYKYQFNKNLNYPKRNDIVVFRMPDYEFMNKQYPNLNDELVVKRCFCTPGEIAQINNLNFIICNEQDNKNLALYPHNPLNHWSLNNYGPLWVPKKDEKIMLTVDLAILYQEVMSLEGFKIKIRNDSVFLNGLHFDSYTFKNNYYFMIGDNFFNSLDSRYIGLIPEKNIVGKANLILFSINCNAPFFKKLRWNRILRVIK